VVASRKKIWKREEGWRGGREGRKEGRKDEKE
jgi:hypothetical protein